MALVGERRSGERETVLRATQRQPEQSQQGPYAFAVFQSSGPGQINIKSR